MPSSNDQNRRTDRNTVVEATRRLGGASNPRLIVVSGMLLGQQIELRDAPIVVGRASDCAISLQHPSVSRNHCRIWREGDVFWIEDCGSTNHTYLNGKLVTRAQLRDGDQISVGSNAIKFFVGSSVEASYHDELIDLAIYDSLTGFFNRRHFCAVLDEELEKTVEASPLSLLMLDLDHFKEINDRHGHLVGDQVLGTVARIIRERTPMGLPIGRLGGEEFALALPGHDLHAAARLAETLRTAVAERPIETRDTQPLAVTLSIGVAQADAGVSTRGMLLKNADEQLYRAKQDGRNRVCALG
ncbi:MAG TPA: GGDEF domain-containing protein [Xanthomonadaceae bacterium]|nr:GGDEF domain-containing protein [Xanthomonadaceae bacterium]